MGTRDKTAFRRGENYKRHGESTDKHVPTPGAFGKCKYPKFLLRLKAIEGIKKRRGDIKAPKRLIP